MTSAGGAGDQEPVHVLVVDDMEDIRQVVRLTLELDGRYEVVGEAADGQAAIDQARELQPDVVLLDRSMPVLGGLEALPLVRAAAPSAAVILYTAEHDEQLRQAAVAAGAVDVMAKDATISRLGSVLADALVRAAEDAGDLSVRVGPIPSAAALDWVENTTKIIHAVRGRPDLLDTPVGDEVFETFEHYLEVWRDIAVGNDEFVWAARASSGDVERLVGAWASIDRMTDQQLDELGIEWSGPLGRQFFDALTAAVLEALAAHEATANLAARLQPQWKVS
jgi:CheY-like chemotaxis protein